ncbi:TPA: hypothetical protein DD712_00235 [Candidatus Acetothermia bacterium]|nr:hypothetical protein [Candidatus Acetothermia bacterium]
MNFRLAKSERRTLEKLYRQSKDGFSALATELRTDKRVFHLYNAGVKSGRIRFGLFGRDLLIVALMLQKPVFMKEAIRFVCATLGQVYDPETGEEPGRGLHEFTDVEMKGRSTRYNAAEVSLLLLIVAADYQAKTGEVSLIVQERDALTAAINYLYAHLEDGLFVENPGRCGADRYALRVTYWKDSKLPRRDRDEPAYPVVYTLVQAQAVAALRAAAFLALPLGMITWSQKLRMAADRAVRHLFTTLWDKANDYPLIAVDGDGEVCGISSDGLHMLAYLEQEDLPPEKLAAITAKTHRLLTPYGYRTYAPVQPGYAPDSYHLGAIWPYEQFFILQGALIHGQHEVAAGSVRIISALERIGFAELIYWDGSKLTASGCNPQLWSLAYPQAVDRLFSDRLRE